MSQPAIEVSGLGKAYLQEQEEALLVRRLNPLRRRSREQMWALRDITFRADRGETVGIIGRNGSGKTTLLRMLSGVSAPTTGRLAVRGRVAPLIGVGVGFHPELTGRENVQVNGRLLGLTGQQVRDRYDDIVAFSEIEAFIDTPVKYYSSGMFLRLAFAVAIHTEPEIFVLDEILAVGDLAFQLKCNERMREIQERGTTIVVVTHNLQMLSRLAPRAIVLSHGEMVYDGAVEGALGAYHEVMQSEEASWDSRATALLEQGATPRFSGGASVKVGVRGDHSRHLRTGDPLVLDVEVTFSQQVEGPLLGIMVAALGKGAVFTTHAQPGEYAGTHGPDRPLSATITMDNRLLDGTYEVTVGVYDGAGTAMIGTSRAELFYVGSTSRGQGVVDLAPRIEIDGTTVELGESRRLG